MDVEHPVYRLTDTRRVHSGFKPGNRLVRIAPSGSLVTLIEPAPANTPSHHPASSKQLRKRSRTQRPEDWLSHWKSAVRTWLEREGIHLEGTDEDEAWVRVRLPGHVLSWDTENSALPQPSNRDVLWPASLCFYYHQGGTQSKFLDLTGSAQDNGLEWFQTTSQAGFQDPLSFAQQWILGKAEREKALEDRKKAEEAEEAEEEAARKKTEQTQLDPSSPFQPRSGALADIKTAIGVYPTPPDGIPFHGPVGPASGEASTPLQFHRAPITPVQDHPDTDHAKESIQTQDHALERPMSVDLHSPSHDHTDDLFGDMDDDTYGANDITDMDFDFFDDSAADKDEVAASDALAEQELAASGGLESTNDAQIQELAGENAATREQLANDMRSPSAPAPERTDVTAPTQLTVARDKSPATAQPSGMALGAAMECDSSSKSLAITIKTEPTPPLSPLAVERKLYPSPKILEPGVARNPDAAARSARRHSAFDPLEFNKKLSLSDAKYGADGRFSFASPKQPSNEHATQIGLKQEGAPSGLDDSLIRLPAKLKTLPSSSSIIPCIDPTVPPSTAHRTNPNPDDDVLGDSESDYTDVTSGSSTEDSSDEDAENSRAAHIYLHTFTGKRKREVRQGSESSACSSPIKSDSRMEDADSENDALAIKNPIRILNLLKPDAADWSLVGFPAPIVAPPKSLDQPPSPMDMISPMNPPTPMTGVQHDHSLSTPAITGDDLIHIAQIFADQVILSTLDVLGDENERFADSVDVVPECPSFNPSESILSGIESIFKRAELRDFAEYATIKDAMPERTQQSKAQPKPAPRRQASSSSQPGEVDGTIHYIKPPHIRVSRAEETWELSPPAVAFWDVLGLGPVSGPKNVKAYCVYPFSGDLRKPAETFLSSMSLVYESCRLGAHTRVGGPGQLSETVSAENGLVAIELQEEASFQSVMRAMNETFETLGKALSALDYDHGEAKADAIVIYLVNPFRTSRAFWNLCSAFWTLFNVYRQGCQAQPESGPKPDLVLQIVPIKYIASFQELVVLDPNTYFRLAREVYDRCPPSAPPSDRSALRIYGGASIQLEEPVPKIIPFRLQADPPSDLLHENSYMHVGYAVSINDDWITVAWTDNTGKYQATIWEATIEIMQQRRVSWRLCIARAGTMSREELDTWISFAVPSPSTDIPPNFGTPAAPTSAATPSETAAQLATDSTTADPDARLTDTTDDTYAVVLGYRLNTLHSLTDYRPALASGFLIKRGVVRSEAGRNPAIDSEEPPRYPRGPIAVGVNLLVFGDVGGGGAGCQHACYGSSGG
ncbi:mediator of RNA polymerase II transcription subunit 13 [Coniosporium tulheliwenetii]|uniref:Mediator of RNA polymerase II transcription subunit 13 n=1 Tax=Coniosporium tulheliwenetii TaxID=3383036 RepID=A0ACC2YYJ9_9PEZI|nr:mediator of RNA polymerase II transcription subunit 13 [Cladosporium sp. JES 115]